MTDCYWPDRSLQKPLHGQSNLGGNPVLVWSMVVLNFLGGMYARILLIAATLLLIAVSFFGPVTWVHVLSALLVFSLARA
jgi:hypothetical protein